MLKLIFQYFGHLMRKADSFEKTLMLAGIGGRRRRGHGFGWTLGVGDGQGGLACCSPWGRKELDMTEQLNLTEIMGLLWWLNSKESVCSSGDTEDMSSIPGSRRSPGGGHGKPLQYSCLENSMDRGTWRAIVHRVTKSQTQLEVTECTCMHM